MSDETLSAAQRRIWFADQMTENAAYSVVTRLRPSVYLDPDVLNRVLAHVIASHDALRSRYLVNDTGLACVIDPPRVPSVPRVSLVEARRIAERRFNLAAEPPVRFALVSGEDGETDELWVVFHHIAVDVVSIGILFDEIAESYRRLRAGEPLQTLARVSERPPEVDTERRATEIATWLAEVLTRVSALPTDLPPPTIPRFVGDAISADLPCETAKKIRDRASSWRVTPPTVALAAWAGLMARWSGSSTVVMAVPTVSSAPSRHQVGCLVNVLPVVVRTDAGMTGREMVLEAREAMLDALEDSDVDFGDVVRHLPPRLRSAARPVASVAFVSDHGPRALDLGDGHEATLYVQQVPHTAKFDLTLSVHLSATSDSISIEYDSDAYHASTVESLMGQFLNLLAHIINCDEESWAETIDMPSRQCDDAGDVKC